jgi:hypothetical protein
MNSLRLLGIAAGIAALAACNGDRDDMNAANADLNATDNMMLPEDNLATNVDTNIDTNIDTNVTDNVADNVTDNTVNSY